MQIKFSTSVLLLWAWTALPAWAADTNDIKLQDNPPDRYVVQKGDTLWGIAGKFLKDPWRWPEIWRMNQAQIKNPHWIYPGNVVVLDATGGTPQLRMLESRETVRLSPSVRIVELDRTAVPSIPPADIEPFLSRPLVIERDGLSDAPRIVASEEDRLAITNGVVAYAYGIDETKGAAWQIYRPGQPLVSPRYNETLGYEALYLGDARVKRFGEVSTIEVLNAREEIAPGDRLLPAPREIAMNYVPHAPASPVEGQVIALPGGLAEVGRDSVVAMDVGRTNGVEVGHVLAISRPGPTIRVDEDKNIAVSMSVPGGSPFPSAGEKFVTVPNERFGLVFVFRVFDRVAYGLVLNSSRQVRAGDMVSKP